MTMLSQITTTAAAVLRSFNVLIFSRICTSVHIIVLEEKNLHLTRVPLPALVFCGKLHREGKQPELNVKV